MKSRFNSTEIEWNLVPIKVFKRPRIPDNSGLKKNGAEKIQKSIQLHLLPHMGNKENQFEHVLRLQSNIVQLNVWNM